MSDGRTIVGFEGTPSSWRSLDWALDRVAVRGGRLEILRAVDRTIGEEMLGRDADIVGRVEDDLRLAERHARALAPEALIDARWVDGPAERALIAASQDASLLVVGTDRGPRGEGSRIGSLPLRLAAAAECVVAVIPDAPRAERSVVVVGIDDSARARSALALAVTEASWNGATVEAAHAWDVPEAFARSLAPGDDLDPAVVERERHVVRDVIDDVPLARSVAIEEVVVRQNPAEALVERGAGAVALVVGTRGRGRFAAAVLGSVSHDVLVDIPCPVLVTPREYVFTVPDEAAAGNVPSGHDNTDRR
ncbi:universal stress protein [Leifsonia sp. ZF2019]|uniref:universal stress protein n=1 Tax=Leifsonia sp. ZF2019 TaxID=2781978 RepID=UPI001CBB8AB4|nr:universal stress protein [Leifsonia sp. ZF2019]UAJ77825.1 universal stress protein [Leifsonia sp. ZF2019]